MSFSKNVKYTEVQRMNLLIRHTSETAPAGISANNRRNNTLIGQSSAELVEMGGLLRNTVTRTDELYRC